MRARSWFVGALLAYLPVTSACTPAASPLSAHPREDAPSPDALAPLMEAAPDAPWIYDAARDGDWLTVDAAIRGAHSAQLSVDEPAGSYIHDLELWKDGEWQPLDSEVVPACKKACRLHYRFALDDAASGIEDTEVASRSGDTILSPPSAWLLRPPDDEVGLVFRVSSSPGAFVSGLWPVESVPGAYHGDSDMFWRAPYSAFGEFQAHRWRERGGSLEAAIDGAPDAARTALALGWLKDAARAVGAYFGRYPVPRVMLIVLRTSGARIHGKELGGGGASILLSLGEEATADKLRRDWIATHEMVHLSVPWMHARHTWLTEGLATYVEPLARAQIGLLGDDIVWRDMIDGMPNGLPEPGDRGLDRTPTWGRTYWGGALFALMADIEIRKRTAGKQSLQTALRGVLAAGGHTGVIWPMTRFVAAADQATGTTVLAELYEAWSLKAVPVDLDALWQNLGIRRTKDGVAFDDEAPLARIRKAMTQPLP